jgi:hypothetical protein
MSAMEKIAARGLVLIATICFARMIPAAC